MVSSALGGTEKTKKSFKEKTRKKSIGVGTEMAMSVLGELHEIECHSCLWDGESASKREAPYKDLLPTIEVQEPPPCSKPLSWIDPRPLETEIGFRPKILRATPPAIILTHVPLVPALARQQTAHWEVIITTNISMLALARH